MEPMTAVLFGLMGISLLLDLYFAFLFLRIAELREGPGQLILAQTQAQIILDLHWLTLNDVWSDKNSTTCQIVGFFIYSGCVLACAYSAAICVAVSQYFEKDKYPSLWRYHAAVLCLSLGLCVIMACTGGLGKSAFGDCSLRDGRWTELTQLLILCVAAVISIWASIRFVHRFRLNSRFTWNILLVSLVYLAQWIPSAILHFISYQQFRVTPPPDLLFTVRHRQIADLIAATSTVVTIGIRLSYKPIRDAILMNHLFRSGEYTSMQRIRIP